MVKPEQLHVPPLRRIDPELPKLGEMTAKDPGEGWSDWMAAYALPDQEVTGQSAR
jgi:hypothetical protein